jgi:hypothetical protein
LNFYHEGADKIPVKFLVGNKSDMGDRYNVSEMKSAAEKNGMKYFEMSAKNLDDVNALFAEIVSEGLSKTK